jgi:DNA-binding SARP family transcriptional activator
VDADAFESLAQEGKALERRGGPSQALPRYQDAEALYRGEYLEEDPYADWCVVERERQRERYLGLLERMADLYANLGMFQDAAYQCRKALVREPCREGVHRALMGYLWRMERRDEALAQFRACAQVLSQELDAEPSPETVNLYQRILQSHKPSPRATSSAD